MDWLEILTITGILGTGGGLAKLFEWILRRRRNEVDTEDAINAMAIRQLQAQMEQMSQQVTQYEKLAARYEELERKFNELQAQYNEVILENTKLKVRITQLEKAQKPPKRTNSRSKGGVAPG